LQFSLGQHCIRNVESGKLPNIWSVHVETFKIPVVQFSADFELKCAEGVGNTFQGIADGVSEVVKRINTPFVSSVWVRNKTNSVDCGISEGSVWRFIVNLRSEDSLKDVKYTINIKTRVIF
jgi:hypothetical protein